MLLLSPNRIKMPHLLNRVVLQYLSGFGECVTKLAQLFAWEREEFDLVDQESRFVIPLHREKGWVVPVIVDLHEFLSLIQLEGVLAHCDKFKVKLLLHEDLVEIDGTAFAVDYDRLLEARWFADCDASSLDKVDLRALVHRSLNDLTVTIAIKLQHDHDVVNELLFAILKDWVEVRKEFAEKQLYELILEPRRELLVEVVLFDDHAVIASEWSP